jgi:metallo-beta-lactamase family protein
MGFSFAVIYFATTSFFRTTGIQMKLTFLGGAGTVTGSRYLLEYNQTRILIDCGLFEGPKSLRMKNWEEFPVPPSSIAAVILTHAHPDHSGYLPRLVREGFQGPVYSTGGTRDLCHILLKDSARLMEEQAEYCNRHNLSKHEPALPLYSFDDVEACLPHFRSKRFNTVFEVEGLQCEFSRSGHILGSAHLRVTTKSGTKINFTGDVGRPHNSIMNPPEAPLPCDILVLESMYGDRVHTVQDPRVDLQLNIIECLSKGGSLLMPAYSVGRAQQILYTLFQLKKNREIPRLPIFMDSPMSSDISYLYCAYKGDHIMDEQVCAALFDDVYFATSPLESKQISAHSEPKIVIASDSCATGGRVLHHIKRMAPDERNTILFTGHQPAGTRGATMVNNASFVKIHGEYIKIAAKVLNLDSFSAHADADELCDWLEKSEISPDKVFITHGEASETNALKLRLSRELGWNCTIPAFNHSVTLEEQKTKEEALGIHN